MLISAPPISPSTPLTASPITVDVEAQGQRETLYTLWLKKHQVNTQIKEYQPSSRLRRRFLLFVFFLFCFICFFLVFALLLTSSFYVCLFVKSLFVFLASCLLVSVSPHSRVRLPSSIFSHVLSCSLSCSRVLPCPFFSSSLFSPTLFLSFYTSPNLAFLCSHPLSLALLLFLLVFSLCLSICFSLPLLLSHLSRVNVEQASASSKRVGAGCAVVGLFAALASLYGADFSAAWQILVGRVGDAGIPHVSHIHDFLCLRCMFRTATPSKRVLGLMNQ